MLVGVSPINSAICEPDPDPVVYALSHSARVVHGASKCARRAAIGYDEHAAEECALDPDLPLLALRRRSDLAQRRWFDRVRTMFATFAIIALVLSVGLHAMTVRGHPAHAGSAFDGAQQIDRSRGCLSVDRRQLAIDYLGMAGAFGVGRLLRTLLAQTAPTIATLVVIATVFVVVSLTACYFRAA
jgi:hypothetical protein